MAHFYKHPNEPVRNSPLKFNELSASASENQRYDQLLPLANALKEFYPQFFSNIDPKDEYNNFSDKKFIIFLIQFLYQNQIGQFNEKIDSANILQTSKLLSIIYHNLELCANKELQCEEFFIKQYSVFFTCICLHNLNVLTQDQIKEFDFNPFLKIISMCYGDENTRLEILKSFPISFIINNLLPFIKPNLQQYSYNLLLCFNSYCLFPHQAEDSKIIFNELVYIRDTINDPKNITAIIYIIQSMIKFDTLPIELFDKYKFSEYFTNLVGSTNEDLVNKTLLVIGKTIHKGICEYPGLGQDFILKFVFEKFKDESIFMYSLWILSFCLDKKDSIRLIKSGKFYGIVNLYPQLSMNSKTELSLFVCNILEKSNEFFLASVKDDSNLFNIINLLVDSLIIGEQNVVKEVVNILNCIINTLLTNQNPKIESIIQFLLDNDIFEIIEQLKNEEYEESQQSLEVLFNLILQSCQNQRFNSKIKEKPICSLFHNNQLSELIEALKEFSPQVFQEINQKRQLENCTDKQFAIMFIQFLYQNQISQMKEKVDSQNILMTSKLLSIIYYKMAASTSNKVKIHDCFDMQNSTLLTCICLHNLNVLSQDQIKEFDFNPFLKIISMCYSDENARKMSLEYFQIPFIINNLLPFIKPSIHQYSYNLLLCFNSYCLFPHQAEDSKIIFNELVYIRDTINDPKNITAIIYIIQSMIKFDTLPIELFDKYKFSEYFTNLVGSTNEDLVNKTLLVIGKTIHKGICEYPGLGQDFYFKLLFERFNDEVTFVYSLWILSLSLDEESSAELIESGKFYGIVNLYPQLSMNSKTELSLFVCNILEKSNEFFLASVKDDSNLFNIINLLVDSLIIGEQNVVKEVVNILNCIINTLLTNQNPKIESIIQFLLDNDIFEIIESLISEETNENHDNLEILYHLINQFVENEEPCECCQ